MIVSRTPDGHWVEGEIPDSTWSCDAPSIGAAKKRYERLGLPVNRVSRWPAIQPGMYVTPEEFTPIGRVVAKAYGCRFYVGKACKHHPLNHVRVTGNKCCVVCEILSIYTCK